MLKQDISEKEKWICAATQFFEQYKDPHTKWIHFCAEDPASRSTIPIFENLCYVVALFRLHQLDMIKEAEERLTHILGFQQEGGLFPVYLHLFSREPRYYSSSLLLVPLLLLYRYYYSLFSAAIKEKFSISLKKLLHALNNIQAQDRLPPLAMVMIGIANHIVDGKEISKGIFELPSIGSSTELSHYFLIFQLLLDTPYEKQFHLFYEVLSQYLDSKERLYIGPLIKEKYDKGRPITSLLEAVFFDRLQESTLLFYTPLINALAIKPLIAVQQNSIVYQDYEWCYRVIGKSRIHLLKHYKVPESVQKNEGLHLLRILTENGINLALFPGLFSASATIAYDKIEMMFTLLAPSEEEEEIKLFLTKDEQVKVLINNKRASAFSIHDKVSIIMKDVLLSIQFQIEEGSGLFFGSLSFGSRPCENSDSPFLGTDWVISVRFTKRTEILKGKMTINLLHEEKESQ
ncbi:MAG: hypothetical protein HY860_00420 [Chlamydiales bacterium]|nr:hypothetical protein [Chlamydiales bacterium]